MQKRTVPLSLIISAALSIPSLAMAVSADIENDTAMDMNAVPTQDMMQNQAENPNVEPFSTQAEVAPRDPEMQAYDEPYNDQSNDPNSDLNNDSNYQAQTADADVNVTEDANTVDMNPTDMNNADMNNVIVEEMPQSELENPNAELMATQPAAVDSTEFEAVADNEVAVTNPEMQAQNDSSAPNQQHSSPDYQPLITGETDDSNVETASTLQEKTKDKRGELLATQPAEVEISEERFMVSR